MVVAERDGRIAEERAECWKAIFQFVRFHPDDPNRLLASILPFALEIY